VALWLGMSMINAGDPIVTFLRVVNGFSHLQTAFAETLHL
jgi:hypothetical protein